MSDYIDREELVLHLNDVRWTNAPTDRMTRAEHLYAEAFCRGITEAMEAVEDFPAADVAPVRHGLITEDDACPFCGCRIPTDDAHDAIFKNEVRYCYYCGAKMDGVDGEV